MVGIKKKATLIRYYVAIKGGKWVVSGEHGDRATSVHKTKDEAVQRARAMVRRTGGELLVRGRDGRIKDHHTFGSQVYLYRDTRTGSFTTKRSTSTIKSNVSQFTPALERLAKK